MIEQIGQIIKTQIESCGLVWVDKVFGVVNPVTYSIDGKTITEASLCNQDIVECDSSEIVTAEPNSSYNSLIFIEPFEPKWKVDRSCNFVDYQSEIKIYVWINRRNVQVDDLTNCDDEFVFKQQLIKCLNDFTHNSTTYPNYFQLCHIKTEHGSEISKNYSFSSSKKTLLDQVNYEFVLTFDTIMRVNYDCLDATVSIIDPLCLPIPFMQQFGLSKGGWSVARLLNNLYLGDCISVRESGGDTLADIGFVMGVMDETALLAHTGSNDGFLDKVYDQSGNGIDLIAPSASAQPKIVSAGSVIVDSNGIPEAFFDGVDDLMVAATLATSNPSSSVMVWATIDDFSGVVGGPTSGANMAGVLIWRLAQSIGIYQSGADFTTGAPTVTNEEVLDIVRTSTIGTDWIHRHNAVDFPEVKNIGTQTPTQVVIGARGNTTIFVKMHLSEYIFYAASDESANFTGWEADILSFYKRP